MSTKAEIIEGIQNIETAKKIANNTVKATLSTGEEIVILHKTIVVSKKDNKYTLNSGGWRTATTKERINNNIPWHGWNNCIRQKDNIWYIGGYLFYDGIVINENGEIISKKILPEKTEKKNIKIKAKITKFCNLITKDNLPTPNNGDCWYCSMHDKDGNTMGGNNHDHLLEHLKENYLHGSLLVNAMREAGYRDEQIGFHYGLQLHDTFKRATRKYLQKRLLTLNG